MVFEDAGEAAQDKYGLSKYRRGKLMDIFGLMDKNGSGAVDYKAGVCIQVENAVDPYAYECQLKVGSSSPVAVAVWLLVSQAFNHLKCDILVYKFALSPYGSACTAYTLEIKEHSAKYGGQALTEEELREVFRDFDTSGDHQIDKEEFLAFFSRSVKVLSNKEFEVMVGEMMD
jgi:hypothetical protein